ncbi:SRPBCC family protein [Nocardia colli]|uniref:SRPBCC family protein n=1 Tax=Nocardia colli TaxID=2545717 RepID=UPI0035E126FC
MAIINVHARQLTANTARAGTLIDSLASDRDQLWPTDNWPLMRLDRPLGVGAIGGHGPVRYVVEEYQPGCWIRFRFTGPRGFDGFHEYTIHRQPNDAVVLQHLLAMHVRGPARLTWPLAFRWLHDALIEDSLDRAESALTGSIDRRASWSPLVRLLRAVGRYLAR